MPERPGRALRSWLYVPGDRKDVLGKALFRDADALIIDLEDAVAADRKEVARRLVGDMLQTAPADGTPSVWVRVNAEALSADVEAVMHPRLDGVVLAKAELDRLAELDDLLSVAESRVDGMPEVAVVPLIETARGLVDVATIASVSRVRNLAIGEADLAAELGIDPADETAAAVVRLPLVVASAAAGIALPTGPVSTDYRDLDALRASTRVLLRQGFRARSAIHPTQVAVINEELTPSPGDVTRAREQIAAFESAGGGATKGPGGTMIDAATVRSARDVLHRAAAAGTL